MLPGVVPLIPMIALLLVIRHALAPTTIPTMALSGAAGALVYLAGYLAIPRSQPASAWSRCASSASVAHTRAGPSPAEREPPPLDLAPTWRAL